MSLTAYLDDVRGLVIDEIQALVPKGRFRPVLYDLMLDYPMRESKMLRPALCIATCAGLGGRVEAVLRTAAVLELYHNAFLVHDDIEDGSELRRGRPTLHRAHGVPVAINVGDAMLALALRPLLDNMADLGLGKAIRIMDLVARMAKESAEGQALELAWVRDNDWSHRDVEYLHMVWKKTGWYTFMTPVLIGATVAGLPPRQATHLRRFASLLGLGFQIQDDVLNLVGDADSYGKEIAGDLHEGKHTLILIHALRAASGPDRARAVQILGRPREDKSAQDVAWLLDLTHRTGAIESAADLAQRAAQSAGRLLEQATFLPASAHRDFLEALVQYVVARDR